MGGHQGIARHVGSPLAIAQDEVWEDRAHGTTRRALEPPDHDPAETDAHIMRMAGQASAATTGGCVLQLKAQGQHEGEDTCEERLPIAQQLYV
jgi:hypothetical protein